MLWTHYGECVFMFSCYSSKITKWRSRNFGIDEYILKLLVTNFDLYLSSIIPKFYMKLESNLIFSYMAYWTEIGTWYKT